MHLKHPTRFGGKSHGRPEKKKKRVTRKLKEVSRFSSAKQRQGSVENSVLHMQNCFLLIRYIVVVFDRSRCLHPVQLSCSINRFYIFFEETISILKLRELRF